MLDKSKSGLYINRNASCIMQQKGEPDMQQVKISYSIDEAAEFTGIGRNTLRKLIEWKKLPVLKVGRKLLIRGDTLETFLRMNEGRDLRNQDAVRGIDLFSEEAS